MTSVLDITTDWKAECDQLDQILVTLDDAGWHTETLAEGWDVRDTIGHLSDTNDIMQSSIKGGPRDIISDMVEATGSRDDLTAETNVDAFTAWQMTKVRTMSGPDVHRWWRETCAVLVALIESLDPTGRYRWGYNMVSAQSLASARMMETWAHSMDVHGGFDIPYVHTDRCRHVAFLGWRAIPHAFGLVGLEEPAPVRMELVLPSGANVSYGESDAPNLIRGAAVDWACVAARRDRDGAARRLEATGPDASKAIEHGRAFL